MRTIADLLAIITHPLLLPVWGTALLIACAPEVYAYSVKDRLLVVAIALNLTLLPIFMLTSLFVAGILRPEARGTRQRATGYALTLVVYVLTALAMKNFYHNGVLLNAIATACVLLLLLGVLLWWRPASAHAAGWWALGMWLAVSYPQLSGSSVNIHVVGACFLIGGLAGAARLAKGEHSLTEVVAGIATGITSPWLALLFT